jgi:hypothetical protein
LVFYLGLSPDTRVCIENFLLSSTDASLPELKGTILPGQDDQDGGDSMSTQPGSREQVNIFFICIYANYFK